MTTGAIDDQVDVLSYHLLILSFVILLVKLKLIIGSFVVSKGMDTASLPHCGLAADANTSATASSRQTGNNITPRK